MARGRRRRGDSSAVDFLRDLSDEIKDFIDDEVVDRGRDTERDLRRVGRNLTDDEDDDRRDGRGRRDEDDDQIAELRAAVMELAKQVKALEKK